MNVKGPLRKYPIWGEFLKTHRSKRFRSAREFWTQKNVGISYPQYSRYEAGDQLPNLNQAIRLFQLLEVPLLEGILEWCKAQIASESESEGSELSVHLEQLIEDLKASTKKEVLEKEKKKEATFHVAAVTPQPLDSSQISLNDVIVFNRSHLKLFMSDPRYRDIFTYINAFAPDWVSTEELAKSLNSSTEDIEKMVEDLSDLGVLLVAGARCRASKKTFYFPDDEDFFQLRNENLLWNTTSILKTMNPEAIKDRLAYRGVVSRELTETQVRELILGIERLLEQMIRMPESSSPEHVYSLCVLLGQRFSRKDMLSPAAIGLTQNKEEDSLEKSS